MHDQYGNFSEASYLSILRDRLVATVITGGVTSAVLTATCFLFGWPHHTELGKGCGIVFGIWAIIWWVIISNDD